ncbi:DUF4123 domain-containing protein [Luteimonas salinilitoris]|uniref:DUF4123 domain-containing protein n=1 Tax=Luteimonas salinilitoris TaxID=3237697 RepID=A0ABV4HRV8_9GAMM
MTDTRPETMIDALWAAPRGDDGRLYAVLDGARNAGIHPAVLESQCEFECLYTGELAPDLRQAAPYLVKLERDLPFTDMLIRKGWGDSWGIFLRSPAAFRDLRRHLRKFLMVYDPDLKPMYFRYYDPRVLRIFLPTCDKAQLAEFFGPVQCYLGEDEAPDNHVLLRFSNDAGTLRRETFPISPA